MEERIHEALGRHLREGPPVDPGRDEALPIMPLPFPDEQPRSPSSSPRVSDPLQRPRRGALHVHVEHLLQRSHEFLQRRVGLSADLGEGGISESGYKEHRGGAPLLAVDAEEGAGALGTGLAIPSEDHFSDSVGLSSRGTGHVAPPGIDETDLEAMRVTVVAVGGRKME
jgi:hypothetical protein